MSSLGGGTYHIGGPTRRCAATGRDLVVGERYVAALAERPDQRGAWEMVRLDFAVDAWDAGARPGRPARLVGSWRSTVPEPNQTRRQLLSDDELMDLFEQAAGAADEGEPEDGGGDASPHVGTASEAEAEGSGGASETAPPDPRLFRYLLCLILMRKKLLVTVGGVPADPKRGVPGEMHVRRRGKAHEADEPWRVPDPGVDEAAVTRAAAALSEVIDLDEEAA